MNDREWLDSRYIIVVDDSHQINGVNQTMEVVTLKDAIEYGERCAKSAKRVCKMKPVYRSCPFCGGHHGIKYSSTFECSSCSHEIAGLQNYCPNCGAEVCND